MLSFFFYKVNSLTIYIILKKRLKLILSLPLRCLERELEVLLKVPILKIN